jgi:hypothetical protein
MDTHIHVVQPFQAPAVQPDRRRRDRDAPPFELVPTAPKEPVAQEETSTDAHQSLAPNEEGVGESVDVVA